MGRIKILDARERGMNKRVPPKYLPLFDIQKMSGFLAKNVRKMSGLSGFSRPFCGRPETIALFWQNG